MGKAILSYPNDLKFPSMTFPSDNVPPVARFVIFLPVRNGAAFIRDVVSSVIAQTRGDWMLVILDNQSTDGTLEVVREFSDERIFVVQTPEPLDIYRSWHRVLEILKTEQIRAEFCTIIGHDDWFYPNFLEWIESLIVAHPDASLYQTYFDLIDEQGRIIRPCRPIPVCESHRDFFWARCWGNRDSFGTGYVFRTADFVRVGGYADFPQLLWADDLLVIRLAELSYKVCDCRSAFAFRLHAGSASGGFNVRKFVAFAEASRRYLNELEAHHGDLIADDYGRVSLGLAMARQMELIDLPFRRWFLGKRASQTIDEVRKRAEKLLQGYTVDGLSDRSLVYRLFARIKKYFIAPRLSR